MNELPKEIADLCGIVVGYTCKDEPKEIRQTYGVFPAGEDGVYEVYMWPEKHPKHTTMGFIKRSDHNPRYRASSIHGDLSHCSSLSEAVEFIHAHFA